MDQHQEQEMLNRINSLYHKKETSGLSAKEQAERKKLHAEFIKNFRDSFRQQIEDLVIVDEHGKEVTSEKAKQAQRRKGLRKD